MDVLNNITLSLLLALTVVSITTQLLIYILMHERGVKTMKTGVVDSDGITGGTKNKQDTIISDAIKQANKIITTAQMRSLDMVEKEKVESRKIIVQYQTEMRDLENALKTQFERSVLDAGKENEELVSSIERSVQAQLSRSEHVMEEKTGKFLDNTQLIMSGFVREVQAKVKSQIDDEMAKVHQEIQTYKAHRMKMIDENIIEILERITQVALGQKLSLSDQSNLIYKALEEAKKEHALG